MDKGLYVAMTGAKQIMQAQAVNNHNIANVNTVGYRADLVSFVSLPVYGAGYPSRVNAVASDSGTDLSSGALESTGRNLDVAVSGKGYIAVRGADGTEAYTRAGDLRVGADGALTTASGLPVLSETGPINLPPSTSVTIGNDGTISVLPVGLTPVAVAPTERIKLVNPPAQNLQKGDDGLLRLKGGSKAATDPTVTLTPGVLESSNVNAAQSLINLIELQRMYESQVRAMNSSDQNEQTAEQMMSNNT
jgi:flagellar basal-body rod protein FlgF